MASLKSVFDLSGSMGNVSFYKRKDMPDETLARTKGGPSRRKVLTDPRMENTRRSAREFGGVATTTMYLRAGLQPLLPVSDFFLVSELNKLLHPIKDMDTTSPWGERAVCISRAPWLLEGFQLNGQFALETIIHGQLALAVSDTGIALTVPALLPGANFTVPPGSFTSYRLLLNAAWVPDMVYTKNGFQPATALLPAPQYVCSPWQLTKAPADSCTLQLPEDILSGNPAAIASGTLMISVGILLGRPAKDGRMQTVKHMGAGKVLAMYTGGELAGKYGRFPAAITPIQPGELAGDDTPSFAASHSYDIHDNADVLLQEDTHGVVQADTGIRRLTGVATSSAYLEWQHNASYSYYQQVSLARTELGNPEVQGVHYAYTLQDWPASIKPSIPVQTADNCPPGAGLVSTDRSDPDQWPAGNTSPLYTAGNVGATETDHTACGHAANQSATSCSYDNGDVLLQDHTSGIIQANTGTRWKEMACKYEVSGTVNDTAYQAGNADALYHRYAYKAENWMIDVAASRDYPGWQHDANCGYYRHGPPAWGAVFLRWTLPGA